METKKYNARFCPKGDIEANWNKAVGFIPLDKEIIIYKPDDTHLTARFKVGDGKTGIQDLPFSGTDMAAIEQLIDEKGELLVEYVDNAVAAIKIPQSDYEQSDPAAADYIKNRPFYEDKVISLAWDGKLEGHEYHSIDERYYTVKVSDHIYTKEDLAQSIITIMKDGKNIDISISECYYLEIISGALCVVYDDIIIMLCVFSFEEANASGPRIFPSNGTYFTMDDTYYVSSLNKTNIKQIEKKFLPDSIANIDDAVAELEGRVTTIVFNIVDTNTEIKFYSLPNTTKIDWGDGTIDNNIEHIYKNIGIYQCKIYDVTELILDGDVSSPFQTKGNSNIREIYTGNLVSKILFSYCSNMTNVTIPNTITAIEDDTFYFCSALMKIVIPDSVTSIGNRAFFQCSNLTSIEIPASVTSIGSSAFFQCSNLTSIEIGNSVTSIGERAFYNCNGLTSIEIPDSVTSIGEMAFSACYGLTSIIFKSPVPVAYNSELNWLVASGSLRSIRVPYGTSEAYRTKWLADGAPSPVLSRIGEFNREAMMSDLVQSDWNQNDNEQLDYIKNRICYEEENVVLAEWKHPSHDHEGDIISINIDDVDDGIMLIGSYARVSDTVIPYEQLMNCTVNDFPMDGHVHTHGAGYTSFEVTSEILSIPLPRFIIVERPFLDMTTILSVFSNKKFSSSIISKTGIYALMNVSGYRDGFTIKGSQIKKIDEKFLLNSNIENGTLEHAIQQKYSLAEGARSVAFGGGITTPEAEKSLAMGASVAKNNATFAANEYTTAEGWASATFGGQTKTSYPYMLTCGFNNENKEENILEVGFGENKYEVVAERPTYAQAMTELKYYRNLGDKGYQRLTPINCPTEEDYNAITEVFEFTGQGWNAFEVAKNGTAKLGDKLVATEDYVDDKIGDIEAVLDSVIALQASLINS